MQKKGLKEDNSWDEAFRFSRLNKVIWNVDSSFTIGSGIVCAYKGGRKRKSPGNTTIMGDSKGSDTVDQFALGSQDVASITHLTNDINIIGSKRRKCDHKTTQIASIIHFTNELDFGGRKRKPPYQALTIKSQDGRCVGTKKHKQMSSRIHCSYVTTEQLHELEVLANNLQKSDSDDEGGDSDSQDDDDIPLFQEKNMRIHKEDRDLKDVTVLDWIIMFACLPTFDPPQLQLCSVSLEGKKHPTACSVTIHMPKEKMRLDGTDAILEILEAAQFGSRKRKTHILGLQKEDSDRPSPRIKKYKNNPTRTHEPDITTSQLQEIEILAANLRKAGVIATEDLHTTEILASDISNTGTPYLSLDSYLGNMITMHFAVLSKACFSKKVLVVVPTQPQHYS